MRPSLEHDEVSPTLEIHPLTENECRPTPVPTQFSFLEPPKQIGELGFLGNYRVLRLLGTGGTAYVFEAEDLQLQRRVALKVLRPELRDAEMSRRFLREARALAALKHPHIVTVYQAGEYGNAAFLAMELLEGQTLDAWLRSQPPFDLAEILCIARQLTDGMGFLHEKGLLHRDIKPANVWLESPSNHVKILDLGLVRRVDDGPRLTQNGLALGTPGFMSPEQARGETLDERSDIFSLGCVFYRLCSGREPFTGPTTLAVLSSLALDTPAPCEQLNPLIPPRLSQLVGRMLEKEPAARIPTARAVLEELDAIQNSVVPPVVPQGKKRRRRKKARRRPKSKSSAPLPLSVAPMGTTSACKSPRGSDRIPQTNGRKRWRNRLKTVVTTGALLAGLFGTASASILFWRNNRSDSDSFEIPRSETVFLRSLPTVARRNWPYYPPPLTDGTVPGSSLEVEGRPTPNGIFMHPPSRWGEEAGLTVALDGQFRRFQARVSLTDDSPGSESPCTFRLIGDGRELWRSKPVKTQADTQTCMVDVRGIQRLELTVSCSGPSQGAYAVWIEPQVTR
jgi:serine/threonine protein kinase